MWTILNKRSEFLMFLVAKKAFFFQIACVHERLAMVRCTFLLCALFVRRLFASHRMCRAMWVTAGV